MGEVEHLHLQIYMVSYPRTLQSSSELFSDSHILHDIRTVIRPLELMILPHICLTKLALAVCRRTNLKW